MKHYPSYELVAWTDHGRLRMIPSLVEELARPDLERLEEQDRCPEDGTAEIDWLIGRSCEYERLADFFRRVGDWEEEYRALDLAARVCSWCSDSLWLQGTHSDFPALPLLYRFLAMHGRALRLARQHPLLMERYQGSTLESHFLWFTRDEREDDETFRAETERRRAWRFGRRP